MYTYKVKKFLEVNYHSWNMSWTAQLCTQHGNSKQSAWSNVLQINSGELNVIKHFLISIHFSSYLQKSSILQRGPKDLSCQYQTQPRRSVEANQYQSLHSIEHPYSSLSRLYSLSDNYHRLYQDLENLFLLRFLQHEAQQGPMASSSDQSSPTHQRNHPELSSTPSPISNS